ncbi:MAG TPA: sugar ABC transporter permease, partial [Anaerovoracaceae bacterium]|nr:sugar ABC transporter permease [Anaerovoracaceae bacterium]
SFLFLLPAALLIIFVFAGPLMISFCASLTDWTGIGFTWNFIGFQNYADILKEQRIGQIAVNSMLYLFFLVFIQNGLAILIALLLNKNFKGKDLFRSLLFMPTVVATVAVGFIWSMIFDPVNGALPILSDKLNLPLLGDFSWLGDSKYAIYLIILVSMWQWTGWNMIIYLAGLQGIPEDLYESAALAGASSFDRFRYITLPLLRPAVTVNIVLSTISVFKFFDLPYILTKGGPGYATETIAITIYSNSFMYNKFGYGSALSFILFTVVMAVTVVQLFILKKGEEDLV